MVRKFPKDEVNEFQRMRMSKVATPHSFICSAFHLPRQPNIKNYIF